jgi:UV DNA damage endonuclease
VLVRLREEVQELPRSLTRRLGFAVKVLGEGGLPSHDARRWQSGPHLSDSLGKLEAILRYCDRHDLRMYRMATSLAPYLTHPDLPQFHGQIEDCAERLAEVGGLATELDIRLSSHPGQYTVLNSESEEVRASAIAEVEAQTRLFDAMGLPPESIVVVHIGGAAGGKEAGADRFAAAAGGLSERARERVVIENDDRTYSVSDVVTLSRRTGIKVVWDALHHHCNDPDVIPDAEALDMALATWPGGVTPKIHYSSPRLDVGEKKRKVGRRVVREPVLPQLRAHADLIDPLAFESFLRGPLAGREVDVMLEAKAKDLAVIRLREQLGERGIAWDEGRLHA